MKSVEHSVKSIGLKFHFKDIHTLLQVRNFIVTEGYLIRKFITENKMAETITLSEYTDSRFSASWTQVSHPTLSKRKRIDIVYKSTINIEPDNYKTDEFGLKVSKKVRKKMWVFKFFQNSRVYAAWSKKNRKGYAGVLRFRINILFFFD